MKQLDQPFTYIETAQAPLQIGEYTIRPVARAAAIHWPNGGFIWNRPVALEVQQGDQTERFPIPDITRWGQIGAMIVGAGVAFLLWWLWPRA